MANPFTGSDLVEVAVQMEKNGEGFYSSAAKKISNPKAKALLQQLALDEIEHRKLFENMLRQVGPAQPFETYPGEYDAYLKAHVESQVFTQQRMERLLGQRDLSPHDALQFGIDSERDAIAYYSLMKKFVGPRDEKVVENIVTEERGHFTKLVGLLGSI